MKRCNACSQQFEDHFVFCPADATPLTISTLQPTQAELHLTIIDNAGLLDRLARELRFQIKELQRAWPELKRDPVAFAQRSYVITVRRLRESLFAPNSIAAIATALLILFSVALTIVLFDRRSQQNLITQNILERVQMLELPPDAAPPNNDDGDGAGSQGRVGLRSGKGEGSGEVPKKSSGGGGGGDHSKEPAQVGAVPPPSIIPAAIPPLPPVQKANLPLAGINIDPALWQAMPMAVYGDPRSKSSSAANGSGDGGGMGTGSGPGIGEGNGPGFGPGQDGNIGGDRNSPGCCGPGGSRGGNPNPDDPDHVYPQSQVTERVRLLAKPEPQYSEEARRNLVMGTVVLRVVFSRTGEVTNIRAVQTLPFGLTERAIAAARLIRFRPATRLGQPVNVSMQLEYNFNLY
jgi:TonB family protein